jgi:predicted exporter
VSAATVTDVLRSEKHLTQQLNSLVKQEKLAAYTAISQHYPSAAEQVINRRLIKESLFDSGIAKETLKNLSMSEENINDIYSTFEKSQNTLNIEKWLESAPQNWQQQWLGCENNTCASIISLRGINDLSALASLANNTSIYWVDNVASINSILHHYRLMAALFILIAIISIAVILSFSLNIKSALMIITIPATTIILSVATLSYLGTLFNVFNVFALLLVLGIGLDYAIFHHLSAKHKQATAFAILLSMITTLLAFGLLAFSETTVIQAFGLTLSIGIIYAFLLSPLIPAQKPEVIHEQY